MYLRRNHHLVPYPACPHPFANEHLGSFILVVASSVDEVTACLVESIKQLEARLFVHGAHDALPLVSDAHGTETQRGDVETRIRGQWAVAAQVSGGVCGLVEERHVCSSAGVEVAV